MDSAQATKAYQAGFIVLSCFVSLIGCITTLELLHQRTSSRGAYNWFLLVASAFTMGGGAIWAMHFIGNRAISLNHGIASQQVVYSSAFTVLSFFLPFIVLLTAFYFLGTSTKRSKLPFIIPASILTGTAVCCMHYLANYGMLNYQCSYHVANIVGSAVMAVAASLISLTIFFRLREAWTDTWWKRLACAPFLASAVSGMHWTAAVGTDYIPKTSPSHSGGTNRTQTVIICAALSLVTCVLLLAMVIIRGWKNKLLHNRAQQLVLACAYFDESGRIMLTPEGALPCQKITNRFYDKTFGEDELSRHHSTFLWVFRASRNWPTVKAFIPAMISRLDADQEARRYTPYRSTPSYEYDEFSGGTCTNFSTIFKQLFCVAAQQLANSIHEPLERMGPVFEEPLNTGMRHLTTPPRPERPHSPVLKDPEAAKLFDLEENTADRYSFGRGKYLFLNRRLTKADVAKLAALGYRFGPIHQTSDLLAKNMEVCNVTINSFLERMRIACSPEHLPPPGVHLACFILRPSVSKSFDVLVPERTQNQLPFSSLHLDRLKGWQIAFLQRFDEWIVKDIISAIINESGSTEVEKAFLWQFHASFLQLIDLIGDTDAIMNATFSSTQFQAPCRAAQDDGEGGGAATGAAPAPAPAPAAASCYRQLPATCTLLTVRLVNSLNAKSKRREMLYVPLSFFSAQQLIEVNEINESNSDGFTIKLNKEFGYQPSPVTRNSRHSYQSSMGASTKDSRVTTASTSTTSSSINNRDSSILHTPTAASSTISSLRRGAAPNSRIVEESIIFSTMEERCVRAVRVSGGSTTIVAEGEGLDLVVANQETCRLSPLDSKFDDASFCSSKKSSHSYNNKRKRNRQQPPRQHPQRQQNQVQPPRQQSQQEDGDETGASDMVMIPEMEYEKVGWVTELFALFRL